MKRGRKEIATKEKRRIKRAIAEKDNKSSDDCTQSINRAQCTWSSPPKSEGHEAPVVQHLPAGGVLHYTQATRTHTNKHTHRRTYRRTHRRTRTHTYCSHTHTHKHTRTHKHKHKHTHPFAHRIRCIQIEIGVNRVVTAKHCL